jgi:hypothetical protein
MASSNEPASRWKWICLAQRQRRLVGTFGRAQRRGHRRSLENAGQSLLRAVRPGDTCWLRAGVYRETLRPLHNGSPDAPIIFAAHAGETVVLSGADPVGGWQAAEDGLFRASLAWDLADENQLFAGEEMLTEARWPNLQGTLLEPARALVASGSANTIVDPNLPGDDDFWKGAVLWCAGGERWYCWSATVTGFDAPRRHSRSTSRSPTAGTRRAQGNPYVLMGVRNALDAEGEWWLDRETKTLWLKPPAGGIRMRCGSKRNAASYAIDLAGRAHIHVIGIGSTPPGF